MSDDSTWLTQLSDDSNYGGARSPPCGYKTPAMNNTAMANPPIYVRYIHHTYIQYLCVSLLLSYLCIYKDMIYMCVCSCHFSNMVSQWTPLLSWAFQLLSDPCHCTYRCVRLWVYFPVNYHRYGEKTTWICRAFTSRMWVSWRLSWISLQESTDLSVAQEVQRQGGGGVGAVVLGRWAGPGCHWHAGAVPWAEMWAISFPGTKWWVFHSYDSYVNFRRLLFW